MVLFLFHFVLTTPYCVAHIDKAAIHYFLQDLQTFEEQQYAVIRVQKRLICYQELYKNKLRTIEIDKLPRFHGPFLS